MRLDCGIEYFIGQKNRHVIFSSELIFYLLVVCHLRNEFNFWNVHGSMNTLGLLQSRDS